MVEKSERQDGRLQRFILFVFLAGWMAAIAVIALFMRAWIPDVDLKADLAAIEEADTDQAVPNGPTPPVLQPLSGPIPAFPVSGSAHVPLYGSLYVGGQPSLKNLSATLSLRNTSTDQALVVTSAAYFDGNGKIVAERFDKAHVLATMAAAELSIDQTRRDDGPVATVVVRWGS